MYSMGEVETLRLCKRALDQGFRPKDVVGLSTSELEDRLHAAKDASKQHESAGGVNKESLLAKLKSNDIAGLRIDLRTAAMNLGPREFVRSLAQPLVGLVGELWAADELEIRHEHLISQLLKTQLHLLMSEYDHMAHEPRILLTTLPGESHVLGLEMVSLFLITCGATPLLLGIETPPDQIARAADALRADAVGLTVTPFVNLRDVALDVDALCRMLPPRMPLWIGGSGAAKLPSKSTRVLKLGDWESISLAVRKLRISLRDR